MEMPSLVAAGRFAALLLAAACGSPGALDPTALGPPGTTAPGVKAQPASAHMATATAKRAAPKEDRPPELALHSRVISFDAAESNSAIQALRTSNEMRMHLFVRFGAPLQLDDFRALDLAGVQLLRYLDLTVYVASVPTGEDAPPVALTDRATWFGQIQSIDKLHPALADRDASPWAVDPATGAFRVHAVFFSDVFESEVQDRLDRIRVRARPYGANNSFELVLPPSQLDALLALDVVEFVEEVPPPSRPLNDHSRAVTHTDAVQGLQFDVGGVPGPTYTGRTGSGIRIGICDLGIVAGHLDFVAAENRFYGYPNPWGTSSHGTFVASIAAGNGNAKPADLLRRGHAPKAMIGDYIYFNGVLAEYQKALGTGPFDDGTDVTNHSYSVGWFYSSQNGGIDDIVCGIDVPARPLVWGAGNNGFKNNDGSAQTGYYSLTMLSKNPICVGSIDAVDGRVSEFSSRGPTIDGRIKPDLVAPGSFDHANDDGISAANSQGPEPYRKDHGTSFAAPAVTGIIALMMEEIGPSQESVLPSTFKALLVHSAEDLFQVDAVSADPEDRGFTYDEVDTNEQPLYHAGPDFSTGWGLVNAEAAVDLTSKQSRWLQCTIGSGVQTWCIEVPIGTSELKVVLAWDDSASEYYELDSTPRLLNDLDLVLVDPTGLDHRSYRLDPPAENPNNDPRIALSSIVAATPATDATTHDAVNNVEMVRVSNPMNGVWEVRVDFSKSTLGGTQNYSLVASQDIIACGNNGGTGVEGEDEGEGDEGELEGGTGDGDGDGVIVMPGDGFQLLPPGALILLLPEIYPGLPRCGEAWKSCFRLRVVIELSPEMDSPLGPTRAIVFDDSGAQLAESVSQEKHVLDVKEFLPGTRVYAALTDSRGKPLEQAATARIVLQAVP